MMIAAVDFLSLLIIGRIRFVIIGKVFGINVIAVFRYPRVPDDAFTVRGPILLPGGLVFAPEAFGEVGAAVAGLKAF